MASIPPVSIAFLLFPNVTQLDLTGPAQVLSRLGNVTLDLVSTGRRHDSLAAAIPAYSGQLEGMMRDADVLYSGWPSIVQATPHPPTPCALIRSDGTLGPAFGCKDDHPVPSHPRLRRYAAPFRRST